MVYSWFYPWSIDFLGLNIKNNLNNMIIVYFLIAIFLAWYTIQAIKEVTNNYRISENKEELTSFCWGVFFTVILILANISIWALILFGKQFRIFLINY